MMISAPALPRGALGAPAVPGLGTATGPRWPRTGPGEAEPGLWGAGAGLWAPGLGSGSRLGLGPRSVPVAGPGSRCRKRARPPEVTRCGRAPGMAAAEPGMKQFNGGAGAAPDAERGRFPHCVVWTPIPVLTWLFPIIGHMGICTSAGVIRDFAGPYFVSEDNMAFGKPVKYWKLDPSKVYATGANAWDTAVHDASEEYKHRMHNLCCDNCHSHVALALNLMRYDNSTSWNMVKLCFFTLLYGKYVSIGGFVKTWLPFVLFLGVIVTVVLTLHLR